MILNEKFNLSNGIEIPKLGLGTWLVDNQKVVDIVKSAIEIGYRHIDTAQAYENEIGIGKGIKESGISRNELFITSKIHAGFKTYLETKESINKSLKDLDVEYIDLMLIHAPQPWDKWRSNERYFEENKEVWRALEEAYKNGLVKAIGVSNFLQDNLENLLKNSEIKPMVNQILIHISNTPKSLIDFCKNNDILVEAYSPIAHGVVLRNEKIAEIAKKYNVSIAQLCIKYILKLNCLPLPKTTNIEHMKNNTLVDFDISDKDMQTLLNMETINSYDEFSYFPVFSKK
ncbi:MAG: aldo/keto reductase [Bacilli bacterium]|nr:aldo/keto reductase [Bacilli bacterium]